MVVGMISLTVGIVWAIAGAITTTALAASPEPSGALGGDPRSSGQGPGLVGDPVTAILLVVLIGVVTAVATAVYVRISGGRRT